MDPARFVTYLFVYSGIVLVSQAILINQFQLSRSELGILGVGLCVLVIGFYRLYSPEKAERYPTEYGFFAYGMALLAVILTAIFLTQVFII